MPIQQWKHRLSVLALLSCAILAFSLGPPVYGQSTSGSIAGSIVDPQKAAIPGAQVKATEENQKFTFNAVSDDAGRFVFAQVPPGNYTISVELPGFKRFEQKGVALSANDRLALGNLVMQMGTITETVEVTATAALLKTESAERSEALISKQVENIAVNGRNPLALVGLVSGVVSVGDYKTSGTQGIGNISANGVAMSSNRLTINGMSNMDTGSNGTQLATVSIDSVEEFKVVSGVYQAEFGRSAGAQINVITKSGTSQFHGTGYWAYRHDSLNANTWYNNREGLAVPVLRQNDPGYTIGGPVYIPGKFNQNKDKLFFFWSQEYQHQTLPNAPMRVKLPTALERAGDFSQSVTNTGALFPYIKDPLSSSPCSATNTAGCFKDGGVLGKIPTNRLWAPGMAFLKYLPMPNVSGVTGYNYTSQISTAAPRREDLIRIDYNVSQKLRVFGNWLNNKNVQTSPYNGSIRMYNQVSLSNVICDNPGAVWMVGGTYILNPTTTNEFMFGKSFNEYNVYPETDAYTRKVSGVNFPLLYPDVVTGDFMPSVQYSGSRIANYGPNDANVIGTGYAPFHNENYAWDLNDSMSKIMGAHALKAGIAINHDSKADQGSGGLTNGAYNFGDTTSNPYDTGFGLSNIAVGVFQQFQQRKDKPWPHRKYSNIEWYLQDTWKVNRRLTLDYGMRMSRYRPQIFDKEEGIPSMFDPSIYDASKKPRLYQPKTVNGVRSAYDSVTGQTLTANYIGLVVPGTRVDMNGIAIAGENGQNKYLADSKFIQWGPRLGIALDVFGNQSMVIRTGAAIFYNRVRGGGGAASNSNPPNPQTTTFQYGLVDQIASGGGTGPELLNPFGPSGAQKQQFIPTVYSFTFGIQTKLPMHFVLDTSYVGSQTRHLSGTYQLNPVPYGAAFLPKNQDPTRAVNLNGSSALPANFMRENYPGYAAMSQSRWGLTANYNSLQVSLNRRYGNSLFLGTNYTWSKGMGMANGTESGQAERWDGNTRAANYSILDFDRTHNFSLNFVYTFPSRFASKAFLHALADGWQLSGANRIMSGAPFAISYSIPGVTSYMITGNDQNGRIRIVGDPHAGTDNSPYKRLNGAAFASPLPGSIGMESARFTERGPGMNNWDLSVEKTFTIKEKLRLRMRVDAFNVLNHTQLGAFTCTPGGSCTSNGGINNTINFKSLTDQTPTNLPYDANGNFISANRNGFGTVTGARDPRILQLMVRLQF